MIISSDIYELIKSLSKAEKNYFRKHSSVFIREEGKRYMLLFNAIDGQKVYDELKLMKHFKGERFVKQFSVAKNYLYNRILAAMESYHSNPSSDAHSMMNRADFLFEKGLYRQADKMLRRGEKFAKKHELHSALIAMHYHHAFDHHVKRREPKKAEQRIAQAKKETELLNNYMQYSSLLAQTMQLYNLYGKTKNKKYIHDFNKLMKHPLLKDESGALTFNGKRRFYDIHAVYNSIIENERKAYQYSQKIISLYDSDPEKIKHNAIIYAGYINNTLLFCHSLKKFKEIESYLEKLKMISPLMKTPYQKARLFEIHTNNYLNLYNSTGRFSISKKILPDVLQEITTHQKKLAPVDKLLTYGNIANTYFGLEDYKNCIHWTNKIRNELPLNLRPDLDSEIRMLNIIAHYELGNEELIPHLVISYYHFQKKKSSLSKSEKLLLSFLKKLPAISTEEKLIDKMKTLKKQLSLIQSHSSLLQFFDITSWIESKIENRMFAEVVRKKTEKSFQ